MPHPPCRRVTAAVLLAAVAALLAAPDSAAAQARPRADVAVVDVRVEGNETIPSAVILQRTRVKSGRVVTDRELLDDVRRLYETKWFSRVRREVRDTPAGPVAVFLVKELPQVASVRYVGNEAKSDVQLSRVTGLEPGSPYRVMFNRDAAEQLKRYYVQEGFRHAKVQLARGDAEEHRDVVFQIEEGPKVRVAKVSFEGNRAFSDAVLKRDLETKTKLLGVFSLFGMFDPTTVPRDEAAVTDYYRDLGYFDVKVEAEVSESDDRASVFVTFHVEEGPRYRVRDVILRGNDKLSDDVLLPDPELKPGDYYNARFLRKDRQQMEKLYGAEGRLFTKILPVPEFLETPGEIALVYQIEEDKVRYVRHINATIVGDHPHTQVSLIHNQSLVHPGDKADPELIRKTKARIGGSPVFGADVELNLVPVEEEPLFTPGQIRGQSPDPLPLLAPEPPTLPGALSDRQANRSAGGLAPRPKPLNELGPRADPPRRPQTRVAASLTTPLSHVRRVETSLRTRLPATVRDDPAGFVADRLFRPLAPQPARPVADWTAGPRLTAAAWVPTFPRFDGPEGPMIEQLAPRMKTPEQNGFVKPTYRAQSPAPAPGEGSAWETAPPFESVAPSPVVTADGSGNFDPFRTVQQTGGDLGPGVSNPLLPQSPNGGPFQGPFAEPPPFEERPGFVDIDVRAREERTGRFMVGAAVNSSSGLVGQVTLQEDNFDLWRFPRSFQEIANGTAFRGRGQRLRIEAVPGAEVSRYLISVTDPYFLDSLYSVGVSGFYYSRFYEEFSEQRLGGKLTVGRQLTPFWSIVGNARAENVKLFDPEVPTPPKLDEALGDNALFVLGAALKYDSRDRAILPSEGACAEFGYSQGLGDFTYPRFDAEGAKYWTLAERPDGTGQHVLSVNGSLGIAGDDLPIFESYYLGGYQTLRGYDFRGVSPLQNGVRVGGRFSTFGSVQYRFPILVNDALQGVVFTDFGTVNESVSLDDFRASVGAGVRVSLPQAFGPAPLAFDFAVPVAGPDFDDEQLFSFNIGLTR